MIPADAALASSYDYSEVARSLLIAIAASYVALDLAGRVTAAKGRARLAWLGGGATAMGIGIWATHLKGMLAFHLPVAVEYHWPTLLAALLVAIFAAAVALYVTSRQKMGWVMALPGSVMMGGGIVGLHYTGMAAMRLPAIARYSLLLVTLSILLAILFSLIALLMAFDLREETRWTVPRRLGSAIIMGAAVSAMHYTGMAAASFIPALPPDLSHAVSISALGNNAIAIVTSIVLVAAMVTSSVDRRTSAEVERLNQDLEHRVAERTSRLESVNQALRNEIIERERAEWALQEAQAELSHITRMTTMGELAGEIAHEVNQPLAAIVMNANFCIRQLASAIPNSEMLREAISEIVEDGTRASAVISRIRALLQKNAPVRLAVDINQIIREVTILLRGELARNRVSLRTDLGADLARVLGDRVQLQQVLINLVMNGIDAMRSTTSRPRELLIRSAQSRHEVSVLVQDSGIGFDPQLAERVFEPFFTTKAEGIGMGLSIAQSIVESHGGRLWAESSSQGALFHFTLPLQ
jgi:NO-binding membrane sensor protein with MHYT domain